jgi:hypothetical protein
MYVNRSAKSRSNSLPRLVGFVGVLALSAAIGVVGCSTVPGTGRSGTEGGLFGLFPLNMFAGAPAGQPIPGAADAGNNAEIAREIEEADIVKVVGSLIYVLNRHRGLLIIDVSDPAAPFIAGELDLRGRGVEMYVLGPHAYVLLSADYYYAYRGVVGPAAAAAENSLVPPPDFDGSQLAVVDISDPSAPALKGKINLVGFANASRRVGNVIYVVGTNAAPFGPMPLREGDWQEGFVASVNVANPDDIVPVERKTFSGHSLNVHVSQADLFAASTEYDFQAGDAITRVQIVDISDAAGTIAIRGSVRVPGTIRNRFYMDDYQDVLRVATESWGFGFRTARLFTYDISNQNDIKPLGQIEIVRDESLEAVRFDGPRGYVVTFFIIDPLFVIDLSNPANPVVTGKLEVPGYSTHIEPRGNRLIAVGIDDTDGWRPAVAYYDVSNPQDPKQLSRIVLGPPGQYADSEAIYDEKAFKVVDPLGLIAIPFGYTEYTSGPGGGVGGSPPSALSIIPNSSQYRCYNGVQLVDFNDSGLTQRGAFDHHGRVERVGVLDDLLFALSQSAFQTVDIRDRDEPAAVGDLAFFDEEEMNAFECGYYGPIGIEPPWTDWVDVSMGFPFPMILRIFLDGDPCGTISILPATMLTAGLGLVSLRHRRRRRQR